jgi:phycoerythrin-associated linker protein
MPFGPASRLGVAAFANTAPLEWTPNMSNDDLEIIIKAVYRQVLGNAYVMESERMAVPESQFKLGNLSVREFVRAIAKSEAYRSRFLEKAPHYRVTELNFRHLLGRAPNNFDEMKFHSAIVDTQGFEADIDSYIDSDEYQARFGENMVPFNRGSQTEAGLKQLTFNRSFQVDRGPAQVSSAVKSSQLVAEIPSNAASKVRASSATVTGSGTERKLRIVVKGATGGQRRVSTTEYIVSASKMTPTIQRINRTSGKIVSITEVV